MELRERNYRSRLGSRRSTKARRENEAEETEDRPMTDRERFSVTRNYQRKELDVFRVVKKWLPFVLLAAILYWVLVTYVL